MRYNPEEAEGQRQAEAEALVKFANDEPMSRDDVVNVIAVGLREQRDRGLLDTLEILAQRARVTSVS